MMKKIPVYLFLGFLESGKTTLIQKTLANERFGNGENILLLVCEEGLEEYDLSKLKQNNITLHVMEESTELEESSLLKLSDECGADRVVIEYNGMWHLNDLLMNKPESRLIFQTVFAADASTIAMYLQSCRSLVVDKVNICDLAIFDRCHRQDKGAVLINENAVRSSVPHSIFMLLSILSQAYRMYCVCRTSLLTTQIPTAQAQRMPSKPTI